MNSDANNNDLLLLKGSDVLAILNHKEREIIDVVGQAYVNFSQGLSSLPHSVFLRFPDNPRSRIIGLPAYSGGEQPAAGMKWIASFPDNITQNLERASATIILNSTKTGFPYGVLEGSIISAKRTAASAALAAKVLSRGEEYNSIGIVGCGLIGFEILKFTCSVHEGIQNIFIFDLDEARAKQFAAKIKSWRDCNVTVCSSLEELLGSSKLITFATTAGTPYLNDGSLLQEGSLVLHISLRDISAGIIRDAVNIVDDLDHVNRENTSIYLASQEFGNTDFVLANIGDVLQKKVELPKGKTIIYSPFGLGVLDMALANYVYQEAKKAETGLNVEGFMPEPWTTRGEA